VTLTVGVYANSGVAHSGFLQWPAVDSGDPDQCLRSIRHRTERSL